VDSTTLESRPSSDLVCVVVHSGVGGCRSHCEHKLTRSWFTLMCSFGSIATVLRAYELVFTIVIL